MKKVALFAFRGEPMCFIHVLLNGLDMQQRGFEVKIVIEGEATGLVREFQKEDSLLYGPFQKAFRDGIIEGICKACSQKMGTFEEAKQLGLKPLEDMGGHPSMGRYLAEGFMVVTF